MMARDLTRGMRVLYGDTPCTILAAPTTKADLLGRPTLVLPARREDTGAEGAILYGEQAQVWLIHGETILAPGDPGYDQATAQVVAL